MIWWVIFCNNLAGLSDFCTEFSRFELGPSESSEPFSVSYISIHLHRLVADPDRVTRFLEPGQNFQYGMKMDKSLIFQQV